MFNTQQTLLQPPVNIPLMTANGILSAEWRQFFNALNLFLVSYQYVLPAPNLTTTQIGTLSSVANGSIVYNTTTNSFQGYVAGAWKTFTLT